MGDGGGRRKGERHKDTDGVSFVANIYAISYPYTSPVRSCHLDSRLDGKPVVISIFHFARATRASRSSLPLPPRRLITTKRRFPFPPTQENFASSSLPPSRLRLFNPAPIFLFDRSISRAASRETAESGNQRFWSAVSVSDKNLLRPEMGEGIGPPATITICKSLQDRSEVCGVRDYVGDNVVQRGGRGKEGRGIEKKGKQEIYGNRS